MNWFRQLALYGKVSPEDYEKLDYVYRTKAEVQTMLVATLEQERQKIYQQGKSAGLTEGEAAGLAKGLEAQRQTLLRFAQWRFQTSEAEQKQLTEQLAQIHDLQQLIQLGEAFLQATTLSEFMKLVAVYLPKPISNN